jgi:hypothetical protein
MACHTVADSDRIWSIHFLQLIPVCGAEMQVAYCFSDTCSLAETVTARIRETEYKDLVCHHIGLHGITIPLTLFALSFQPVIPVISFYLFCTTRSFQSQGSFRHLSLA